MPQESIGDRSQVEERDSDLWILISKYDYSSFIGEPICTISANAERLYHRTKRRKIVTAIFFVIWLSSVLTVSTQILIRFFN